MKYRGFKRKSDGRWLMALISTTKPELRIPQRSHAEQVAPPFGLTAGDLDVVDADADPQVIPLLLPSDAPPGAVMALVQTLLADVVFALQANGIILPSGVQGQVRDRLRDRLNGTL